MTSFFFERSKIPDVALVTPFVFNDARGRVNQVLRSSAFEANGLPGNYPQANITFSHDKVLRGIHYQRSPRAQGKLVTVLQGLIYDVVVDLRHRSPTYRQWVAFSLDADDHKALYVPPGFGHGFCTPSGPALVLYQMTDEYVPELDGGIAWNDPDLGIPWPIADPILSERDSKLPRLKDAPQDF